MHFPSLATRAMVFDLQGTTRIILLRINNDHLHDAADTPSEMENRTVRSVGSALAADPQRIEPNKRGPSWGWAGGEVLGTAVA
jgi:hypothetical protein